MLRLTWSCPSKQYTMRKTFLLSAVILTVLMHSDPIAASGATHAVSPADISVKILHLGFMLLWVAGLIYLPGLFRATSTTDKANTERIRAIERTLFFWLATPAGVLTIAFGIWLTVTQGFEGGWLPVKLLLVSLMVLFHLYCGRLIFRVRHEFPSHGPLFFHALKQIPLLLLVLVVLLALTKPILG